MSARSKRPSASTDLSHIINHLGEDHEDYLHPVSPPIFQASMFRFGSVADLRKSLKRELKVPFYTRGYNPTVAVLRRKLAALEGADDALVFASGAAAIAAAIMSETKAGDHVVCVEKPYSWTARLLDSYLPRFGVEHTMVDGRDAANFEAAVKENTRLIYLESPNSVTFELQDLAAVAAFARSRNITTVCDNSYATPLHQNPLKLGVDIVVHSASKYLGGHSDLVAGVLCSDQARIDRIFASEVMTLGGIVSPHDAWLIIRGLRTLHLRVERSAASALQIAAALEKHPKAEAVYHPLLPSSPQYELARRQMKGGGGLLSVLLRTGTAGTETFCNSLQRFLIATSWGGHESLVFPFCALPGTYGKATLPENLVRIYIGLEDPAVLLEDLEQGLEKIGSPALTPDPSP